tara:strand:- start:5523 stop:6035 length:513 start_codon:yes stop_codon:yes gene_type:complete
MCAILPAIATGLSLFQGLAMRSAAQDVANQTYETALQDVREGERSRSMQTTAEGERLKATKASERQKAQQIALQGRRAGASLKARGQFGNNLNLLLRDEGMKTGNRINAINQSVESFARQSGRRVQGIDAQFRQRRNVAQSRVNKAYAQVPGLTSTLLGAASSSLPFFET